MNETIFQKIIEILKTLSSLKGSDGTVRVYPYAETNPDGYPAASVVYERTESEVLDSSRDLVRYFYLIRIIQEKMPDYFGPEKGERIARQRETEICDTFRANNDLDIAGVLRTRPILVEKGYIENNTRIVLDITLAVETTAEITP